MRKHLSLILLAFFLPFICRGEQTDTISSADPIRPLNSFYYFEIGSASDFNTYLSPVRYSGTHLGIGGTWSRAMAFNPERFIMDFDASISMDMSHNRPNTSSMSGFDLSLSWDMLYRLSPIRNLQIGAGAGLELDAGALYLPRNSNNPVAARFSLDVTLNLRADYTLNLGRLPIVFTDRLSIPSLGVFFSPQYGQSYYEIYLGDHSGLAHCGWWGNHFALTNTLMAQIPICNIRLAAGYQTQCRSSYVNKINTRLISNSFMLGIATDWINVTRNHNDVSRKIISVY